MDDEEGVFIENLCFISPIVYPQAEEPKRDDSYRRFNNIGELDLFVEEYLLFLPVMDDDKSGTFLNLYYVVGHKWTERYPTEVGDKNTIGLHIPIFWKKIVEDWIQDKRIP